MKKLDDLFLDKVLKHGGPIVTNLSILTRVAAMHDATNEAVAGAVNRLLTELAALTGEDGEISLSMAEHSFFIEDFRIRATFSNLETFDSLIKELTGKEIGVITFKAPVSPNDMIHLAVALRGKAKAAQIQSELEGKLIRSVSVSGPLLVKKEDIADSHDTRLMARRAYLRALTSFSEMCDFFAQHRTPSMKKTKRAIQSLVDCIVREESFVLGFTALEGVGDTRRLQTHSINVAILSIIIGKRAGFTKSTLSLLGIAALLHDSGKIELPPELQDKSLELTTEETTLMEQHSVDGVRILLRFKGLTEMTILSMLAAYEHHMTMDRSGYPKTLRPREINVVSRIIGVADAYDTLVNAKVFGERMFSPREAPKEALQILYSKSAQKFNQSLVKTLASAFT